MNSDPYEEEHECRNFDHRAEYPQRNERADAGAGVFHEVSAQHATDGATRPDQRHARQWVAQGMRQRGDDPGEQIEKEEADRPGVTLDGVPEDPQEPHVSQQMQEAPVHEHRR